MDPAQLNMLLAADVPLGSSPDFDWKDAVRRLRLLQPQVEAITGLSFELDSQVEDATFFADIVFYKPYEWPSGEVIGGAILALRFSSFGNLFTTWTSCRESDKLDDTTVQRTIAAAEKLGFRYIYPEILEQKYTGPGPGFQNSTWWYRFFDYV